MSHHQQAQPQASAIVEEWILGAHVLKMERLALATKNNAVPQDHLIEGLV